MLSDPAQVQDAMLARILAANHGCAYLQEFGAASMARRQQYQSRVPICTYEEIFPAILRAAHGERGVLTCAPVIAFEPTGGSTAGPKLIPYTQAGLNEFRDGLTAWLDDLFDGFPELDNGNFYWSLSPACREAAATAGGIPIGLPSDAHYFGAELAPAIFDALAVPSAIGQIRNLETWRLATLAQLLAQDRLSLISIWSPTFLTSLLQQAVRHRDLLAQIIATGTWMGTVHETCGVAAPSANATRATLVASLLADAAPDWTRLWPGLRVISCWDQASSRVSAHALRQNFPNAVLQGKGLLATESLMSIPLTGHEFPVLAIESGYFEFRDSTGRLYPADRVELDGVYDIVLTNSSGLYRYAIGDTVKVRGFAARTPTLEFLGRGALTSDLCGEKLTEAFVLECIAPLNLTFAVLAAETGGAGYALILDKAAVSTDAAADIANRIDARLSSNPQYQYARQMGQLAALRPLRRRQPMELWISTRMQEGQRMGDIKIPTLLADPVAAHLFLAHEPV